MLETLPHLPQLLDATFPGSPIVSMTSLTGQLSTRRYHRLQLAGEPGSLIVMQLPEAQADPAARPQAEAFVDVQRFLAARYIPVPRIYAHAIPEGLMLLEDLGDETFDARLSKQAPAAWQEDYGRAIDQLARLHALAEQAEPSDCIALRRTFDASLLRWELDHFREWGLEALHGQLSAADRTELDACFDALTAAVVALPTGLVHRDYQSRNLMWAPDGRLVVLDFQDAFMGPAPYDLVALLCDSYVAIDGPLQDAMLLRYAEQRDYTASQLAALVRGFRLIAVQRKLKDAGRFVFIDRVRQNPSFLRYYPGSLDYVARALRELPELLELRRCLLRLVPSFPRY